MNQCVCVGAVCLCVCVWVLCVCVCVCVGGRHRVCHFCWQGVAVHFCSSNTEFTNAEVCVIDDYEILQTCHQSPGVSFCLTHDAAVLRSVSQTHVCGCVCQSPENREWSWRSAAAGLRGCRSVFSVLDRWVWRSDEEPAAGQRSSGGSVSVLRQAHIPSGLTKINNIENLWRYSNLHISEFLFCILIRADFMCFNCIWPADVTHSTIKDFQQQCIHPRTHTHTHTHTHTRTHTQLMNTHKI